MYFSLVFLIFATAFVIVQCDGVRSKREVEFTSFENTVCTSAHRLDLRSAMMNAVCKPHYTHIALKPEPGVTFNPTLVYVRRCAGVCGKDVVCEPTDSQTIQVPVSVTQRDLVSTVMGRGACHFVNVEEHTSCSCMCTQKEEHCVAGKQDYMKSRCKCECKEQEMKKEDCEKGMGMLWDDKECECKCTMKNMECTSGKTWNKITCKCE